MSAMKEENGAVAIPAAEVQAALAGILASSMFNNAPRMCRLLRFLVGKAISGVVRDTNEYAIGIEVFDRDPSAYSASEDPIVRVQVGRLREKLKTYYSTLGVGSDIEISIPLGSYMPVIQRINVANNDAKQHSMLAIHPFKCISHHGDAVPFTQGLDEELMHQLFKVFGNVIVPHSIATVRAADSGSWSLKNAASIGINHLLEGSVQLDAERIRASIRLVDVSAGCIAWSEQFDRDVFLAIPQQEELASSICGALKHFFCHE